MTDKTDNIRDLNDRFRTTFTGGRVVVTRGVSALPDDRQARLLLAVQAFRDFTKGDDPHGEHDFGALDLEGTKYFWKIDYYDARMEYGSDDPADPAKTTRVLTVMEANEY